MQPREVLDLVGSTPTIAIPLTGHNKISLSIKLESFNPTGSIKDRGANYLLKKLIETGDIRTDTTIIESSSGNFGMALAAYCKKANLRFICVVDPNISTANEMFIRCYGAEIVKVTNPDKNGGYLLSRIEKVKELMSSVSNAYWINQYENPHNADAYYHSIGAEICQEHQHLDYIFLGISSGGTITGISQKVKEKFPNAKVIAVDSIGSVIFGAPPGKRYIPGIGSSIVPKIIRNAKIDDVVMIDEVTTINTCHELLKQHSIFVGGSSGSVYAAMKKYFSANVPSTKLNVSAVFPDSGWKYFNTIYDENWTQSFFEKQRDHMLQKEIL